MNPETAIGLAGLVVLLVGGLIGYLIGKGRITFKNKQLEKNIAKAQVFLDECKDKAEAEVKILVEKAKELLE